MDMQIDRTTAFGLLNFAISYWKAAEHLSNADLNSTHPDAPITFLYYHSVELFLKSFLKHQNVTVEDLKNKIGHNIAALVMEATNKGLILNVEDKEVLKLMNNANLLDARYITTGFSTRPSIEALRQICKNLYDAINLKIRVPELLGS